MPAPLPGSWVWGIDLSTRGIDIASRSTEGEIDWHTVALDATTDRARCYAQVLCDLSVAVRAIASCRPPTVVVVEDPYVGFGDPSYMQGVMAITMGICHLRTLAPVHSVASGTWKATCGNGAAGKEQIMEWAVAEGYTGSRQDHADALGVSKHALHLYELAVQHGDL